MLLLLTLLASNVDAGTLGLIVLGVLAAIALIVFIARRA